MPAHMDLNKHRVCKRDVSHRTAELQSIGPRNYPAAAF